MAARPIDGAEGYRFYLRHDGQVELDEINEYLRGLGMREVQPRMLAHYQKLERHGYRSYVTQNRLDLAVAGDAGWLEELHARYAEIAQPVPIELRWGATVANGTADTIGLSSATVTTDEAPPAATPVVLRLTTSGIERIATVIRSDPSSGRVHLGFDVIGGIDVAPTDAPYLARITVKLEEDSETMPAITDVLFKIERAVARAQGDASELPRVRSLSMTSPLDVLLQSSSPWFVGAGLIGAVVFIRKLWYDGTKSKREAENFQVDTVAKQRALQLEVDNELRAEIERAEQSGSADDEAPIVAQIRDLGAERAYRALTRREFFGALVAAVAVPAGTEITVLDGPGSP